MNGSRSGRIAFCALLSLVAAPASAQQTQIPLGYTSVSRNDALPGGNATTTCSVTHYQGQPGPAYVATNLPSCAGPWSAVGAAGAAANMQNGVLHVQASLFGSSLSYANTDVNATAQWGDVLHVTPYSSTGQGNAAYTVIGFVMSGNTTTFASGYSQSGPGVDSDIPAGVSAGVAFEVTDVGDQRNAYVSRGYQSYSQVGPGYPIQAGGGPVVLIANAQFYLFGRSDIPLEWTASASTYAGIAGGSSPQGPSFVQGQSDFWNTVYISSIAFYDANGADVSSQYSYSFLNGATVGNPDSGVPSTVPEPTEAVLLAPGVLVLVPLAKRRRA